MGAYNAPAKTSAAADQPAVLEAKDPIPSRPHRRQRASTIQIAVVAAGNTINGMVKKPKPIVAAHAAHNPLLSGLRTRDWPQSKAPTNRSSSNV